MQRVSHVGLRQTILASKSLVGPDICRSSCLSMQTNSSVVGVKQQDVANCNSETTHRRHFSTTGSQLTRKVDPKKDYYAVLGVTPTCTTAKVKAAFFRLSKIHHPDINQSEEASEKFHELSEAHEVLTNKRLRHQYEEGRRSHGGVHRGMRSQHYKQYNAKGPIQKGKTSNYDYDEWIDTHYSDLFAKSQKQREKFQQDIYQKDVEKKTLLKKDGLMVFPAGFKVTYGNAAVAATTILAAISFVVHLATDTDV